MCENVTKNHLCEVLRHKLFLSNAKTKDIFYNLNKN